MPGIPEPPHIRFDSDPHARNALVSYLRDLNFMARNMTFLDAEGGVANGKRSLNIDGVWVSYVSNGTANTEDTVAHNLGRAPQGFWVGVPDKAAVIYRSGTAWTSTNIYLKADATTVTVSLFVF